MNWLDFEGQKVNVTARSNIWVSFCCERRHIHIDACASMYHQISFLLRDLLHASTIYATSVRRYFLLFICYDRVLCGYGKTYNLTAKHRISQWHCASRYYLLSSVVLVDVIIIVFINILFCPSKLPDYQYKTRKPSWRKCKRATAVRVWRPLAKKSTANQRYAISYWWLILTVAELLTVWDIFGCRGWKSPFSPTVLWL